MQVKLIVVGGKANKGAIALKLPTIIGRSRDAQLTVAHPMISRQHCEVFEMDGLLMIRDLGSLNGTVVDGQQIREAPLRPDDEFTVGPLTFRAKYQYAGDLDSLPAVKLSDKEPRQGPEKQAREKWSEQVPDFQSVEEPNSVPVDVQIAQSAGDRQPDSDAPDSAAREQMASEEDVTEEVEEEEEPQPTPPPPMPIAEKPVAEKPVGEEPMDEEAGLEQTIEQEKVEELPEFFTSLNPGSEESRSTETGDDDLDDFLKGM